MTTSVQTYSSRLLLALRECDVPGPRIAEALAEVQSHVADTGEDPGEAFGPPREYAARVVEALSVEGVQREGTVAWASLVTYGLGGWLAATFLLDGVLGLSSHHAGTLGLPALLSLLLGAAALVAGGCVLVVTARRSGERVLDPRTGQDMAPPLPRWIWPVLVAPFALALVLAAVLGTTG